ncbi:hypothetical protein [Thauera butanivorans]|uniref:hypothetical protein n=1 Tax=Thauera butanivorans TaxID=86174 RepID=UPI000838BAAF|nr:hypothetical protein [Thauera butanivorans]
MSQSAPATPLLPSNIWYDTCASISAARAVASALTDFLPCTRDPVLNKQIDHLGDLIGAVAVCLDDARRHLDALYPHCDRKGALP